MPIDPMMIPPRRRKKLMSQPKPLLKPGALSARTRPASKPLKKPLPVDDGPKPKTIQKPISKWTKKPRRRLSFSWHYLGLAVFFIVLVLSPEIVGQVLLVGYALLTIIRHHPVQRSFVLALLFLIISPLFTWLTGSEDNGAVLAGYSFAFLGVGVIQLMLEYRHLLREK